MLMRIKLGILDNFLNKIKRLTTSATIVLLIISLLVFYCIIMAMSVRVGDFILGW